ncbi:hypothetical protein TTHERM_00529710 (macronuclear) [Tetrahymena thermophila SB210]|uniref:Uncharacterized protein n=1 Tax=Tetrahymena thermophila (strain SB210) TaxID=312017 RepID=I7LZW1_TETTS|nr:hypothetical protein TTHERM_00529710 [Tetrahymena thermophila SB210]EAR85019.2 hypothetical protein TTHERM_00529710 [Tetrahymena thermophila SB210]|eukprot:XP_001032682.2 hypothetical protein TTHERM_00529710 [Tetrahymena thermophila SB210]
MNQEVQSDSSYVSADLHFEVINSKLDKLMQIVTFTEKKPSIQMQDLLQLNDKEDEMLLFQKQVTLELQNIVNEQENQLKQYRNQNQKKQNQFEKEFAQLQDFYFKENRKLNEMVEYLAKENLKIREQYCEQTKNYYKLLDFIKIFTQGSLQEQTRKQLEQLGVQIQDTDQQNCLQELSDENTKILKKINALERFLIQVLSSYKNNNEKEELLNLKNQLEQKMIEMVDLNIQFQAIKEQNENYKRQLKKAKVFTQDNTNQNKKKQLQNYNKKNESKARQTRGKKINFQEFLKDYEEQFNEVSYNSSSSSPINSNSCNQEAQNNFNKNVKSKNLQNEDESLSEIHENIFEEEKANNQKKLNKQNYKNSKTVSSDDDEESEGEDQSQDSFIDDDEDIDDNKNFQKNRKLLKISEKKENNDQRNQKKGNQNLKESDESDFEESLSEKLQSEEYSSDESEGSQKKKKKKNKTNNKQENKQVTVQKQAKPIPEKKKIISQNKKKTSKKVLKKNQENQDRLFNQLDMFLNMQN